MTAIGIDGEDWLIDGAPTYAAGRGQAFGDYRNGYQNPPIDWSIGTSIGTVRKRAVFDFLAEVTGAAGLDPAPASPAERIER